MKDIICYYQYFSTLAKMKCKSSVYSQKYILNKKSIYN